MVTCRNCGTDEFFDFLNLGHSPIANNYLSLSDIDQPETWYPLRVQVCNSCFLAQTVSDFSREEMFASDYGYFSSTSSSWLAHAKDYVETSVQRLKLSSSSFVYEVASNDGYLLRNFVQLGVPCLGIEPTHNTAQAAVRSGIPTEQRYLDVETAAELVEKYGEADLVIANNVFAHVPYLDSFTLGLKALLKPQGVLSIEVQDLLQILTQNQFDTVYHEHYFYYSLHSASSVLARRGLVVFDVDELTTHGGSLRLWIQHAQTGQELITENVQERRLKERENGLLNAEIYRNLQGQALQVRNELRSFLNLMRAEGKRVAAYGAAAKGNTLLNFVGAKNLDIDFVVDRSPGKLGKFLPGSHIPVLPETALQESRPEYILVLPWNIFAEVSKQLHYTQGWGAQLVKAIPRLEVQ